MGAFFLKSFLLFSIFIHFNIINSVIIVCLVVREGFNEICFEDKKGEEQIFTHAEKYQDTRVKNNAYEWIGNERHLVVKKHLEGKRHE